MAIFFPSIVGVTLLAGGGTIGALALATYGSFFGGMGFGAMLGAVIQLVRDEEAEDAEQALIERAAAVAPEDGSAEDDTAVPLDVAA